MEWFVFINVMRKDSVNNIEVVRAIEQTDNMRGVSYSCQARCVFYETNGLAKVCEWIVMVVLGTIRALNFLEFY